MNRILIFLLILATFKLSAQYGGDYYVATDGNDNNPGTFDQPWRTWQKAFNEAEPGDTVYIRGGVYYSTDRNRIDPESSIGNSGTAANPIMYAGYPDDIANGNWPVLDCSLHCDSIYYPWGKIYNAAIRIIKAQYITFKSLEVRNVFQCDSAISGAIVGTSIANLTFERIRIHDVGTGRGFYVTSGAWSVADSIYSVNVYGGSPEDATRIFDQPDTTRWINCDVWNVMDTLEEAPGNASDAWKVHSYNGNYYEWNGCRAWYYGDDGFDPNGGKRVFKNCWAMSTDRYRSVLGSDLENNGFKVSSAIKTVFRNYYSPEDWATYSQDSMVQFTNCLAMFCDGRGFYHGIESDTTDNLRMYNNTSYRNGINININDFDLDSIGCIFSNNLTDSAMNVNGTGDPHEINLGASKWAGSNNSWIWMTGSIGWTYNPAFTLTDDDFVTVDSLQLEALFIAARNPDGSLPDDKPLMLSSTSELRDGGIDVGLPFYGQNPDVGYSEYRLTSNFDMQDTTALSCIVDITYTGGASASATYHWDFDGATIVSGSGQGPYTVEWPSLGDKTVSLYVEESNNISDTTTNDIYISELTSSFELQDTTGILNPVDVTYTGNASSSAIYHWDFDSATIISGSGQGPFTVAWSSMSDKTVSLYIEEPNYVSDTSTDNIYISELTSYFELQDTAYISGAIDIIYTGNASVSATYYWDFDSATVVNGSGQGPFTVEWPSPGDKTVSLYVEESSFISDTTTNDVCISELTSSFELQDIACISSTVDIIYTGNASDSAAYYWGFDNATIVSGSGQGPYTVEWPIVGDKTVSLHVEECNSVSVTSTNDIYIKNNPVFTIIPYPNDTVTTLDTITLMGISASSYLWSTGDVTQSIDAFNNNGPMGGSQEYWLQVTDETGCSSTDSIVVLFEGPTSSNEFPNDIEIINVYPNPFNNYLIVEAMIPKKGQYMFEVVDTIGRSVKQELKHLNPGNSKIRLEPIYGYPGVYILFVKSDDGKIGFTKIIKSSN